jgi:hypothetical protein
MAALPQTEFTHMPRLQGLPSAHLVVTGHNDKCQWHRGLCTYDEADDTRCPWCHASWSVILRTGGHSCEQPGVWRGSDYRWRVTQARGWREMAAARAQEVDQDPRTPSEVVGQPPAAGFPRSALTCTPAMQESHP